MKNLYRNMLLVAAAAMSFASCSEDATEDVVNPEVPMMELTINAQIDDTRVTLNGDRTCFQWTAWDSEKLGIFTDADNGQAPSNSYKDASTALEVTVPANATKVYAYYPYFDSNIATKTHTGLYVADNQYQAEPGVLQGTNAKTAEAATGSGQFPMIATGDITNGTVSLSFRPVACALALNIYDDDPNRPDEKVTSVSFKPKDNSNNYGTQYIDITQKAADETFVYEGYKSGTITVTLGTPAEIATAKPDAKTNPQQVYICTARVNYTQGGTITVTTDKDNTYTFDITKEIPCAGCDLLPISLNLKKVRPEPEDPVTYTRVLSLDELNTNDTYIIAGNNQKTFAGSATMYVWAGTASSNELNCVTYTVEGETVSAKPSAIGEIKLEATDVSNTYYIKVGNKYLYNGSGKALSMSETNKTAWAIESSKNEGVYFSNKTNKCYIYCNATGDTALRAYVQDSQTQYNGIYFFKKADPNAPQLNITSANTLTVDADGLVNNGNDFPTITYEIKNPNAEWTVEASVPTEDQTWITVLDMSDDGKITLDVASNEGPARSTTVTVTYGDITKTVTVKQEGTVVVPGKSYSYTFTAKVFSANGKKDLGDLPWTLAGEYTGAGYWGYDSNATDRGQQFGAGKKSYTNMTLTLTQSDYSVYSPDSQAVQTVKVNTSGGSKVKATLVVTVGGVQIGKTVDLTTSATEYTFTADALLSGDVVLTYTQTSEVALYIKSISINPEK